MSERVNLLTQGTRAGSVGVKWSRDLLRGAPAADAANVLHAKDLRLVVDAANRGKTACEQERNIAKNQPASSHHYLSPLARSVLGIAAVLLPADAALTPSSVTLADL